MRTAGGDSNDRLGLQLRPGEEVLWQGRPDPTRLFSKADILLIPFSLVWAGFAFFWESVVIATGGPTVMALFGLPFVAVGLHLLVGRFVVKWYQRSRTRYVITSQRGLIFSGRGSLKDSPLEGQTLSVDRSLDGRWVSATIGNVLIGTGADKTVIVDAGLSSITHMPFSFFDVADGEAMLLALDRVRRGGPQDAPLR